MLPPKKRQTHDFGTHRHGEEEEGRAIDEPYAPFLFDPSFLKMTLKLNYSARTHTHRFEQQHSKQTPVGGKWLLLKKSHEFDPSIIK